MGFSRDSSSLFCPRVGAANTTKMPIAVGTKVRITFIGGLLLSYRATFFAANSRRTLFVQHMSQQLNRSPLNQFRLPAKRAVDWPAHSANARSGVNAANSDARSLSRSLAPASGASARPSVISRHPKG